jgi:CheY-like chemotaxis protein
MEMKNPALDDLDLDSAFLRKFARYLGNSGWTHLDHPNTRVLLFAGPLDDDEQPLHLVLPSDINFKDSRIRIGEALEILTVTQDSTVDSLLREIMGVEVESSFATAASPELQTKQETVEPDWVNLNELVAGVIEMLDPTLAENIQLVSNLDPGLRFVKGNPNQIQQVIWNLLANARDAIREAGTLTIETTNTKAEQPTAGAQSLHENHVMLLIRDTGIGIDEATQQRVFEPFFTTKERGIGLGLAVSRAIVEQHGGKITLESQPNVGSVVKVHFPEATKHITDVATGTILVVNEEKLVRELLRELLEARGYTVIEASGAEEATRLSQKYSENIDLLLSDIEMPRMTGPELIAELRKKRPALKGLFLSTEAGLTLEEVDQRDLKFNIEEGLGKRNLNRILRELMAAERE